MAADNLNQRQTKILEMVSRGGEIKIGELSEVFQVSEMTIRRDLERMEQSGLVHRTFGGAIASRGQDISLRERTSVMLNEKTRIGRKATEWIFPGQSIFIDAGTTTLQIVRHLKAEMDITVVTNAINIAVELLAKHIPTIVIGGIARDATFSLVGPEAEGAIAKMAFDAAFLGATGFTLEHGFNNSNLLEVMVKRIAAQRASEVNIVLDHTKFGMSSLYSFASLNNIQRLFTDEPSLEGLSAACRQQDVELVVCS